MGAEDIDKNISHWSRLEARLLCLTPRQRFLTLILLCISIYGVIMIMDGLFIRPFIDHNFAGSSDLHIFQERAKLILNGGTIYRDVPYGSFRVESPPLINYLFLPPQLAGGEWWAYEIWFSFFSLLTSLVTYVALRGWNDHLAFIAALLILLSPYLIIDSTVGQQDEPIVAFFFILPILLFLRGREKGGTIAITLGFWTKFLSGILFPVMLQKIPEWRKRLYHIGLAVLITLLISIPFLYVTPIEFLQFPGYYTLGEEDGGAGMSIVGLLSTVGIVVPGNTGALITIAGLFASYAYCWRRGLDIWRSCLVVTTVFLCIYPMIRLSYFIFPFMFLAVWSANNRRVLLRAIGMYVPLTIPQFVESAISDGNISTSYAWIGLVFLLIGFIIMIDATRIALKSECFLDHPYKRAEPIFKSVSSISSEEMVIDNIE
ncbi:MAG: hypothetical protein GX369_04855 [Euryarchaeota archaeon]|nr:hypothetical protein [Euryarchaeota archaeon]